MKFEKIIKTAVILTGAGLAVSGMFDIRKGRGFSGGNSSCRCGEDGDDGFRAEEEDENIIDMEKECGCGLFCCPTARGILKVLTGGVLLGLGFASAFLNFEEKIAETNPEMAERIARAEEWCQKILDDGTGKGKILAARGLGLAAAGKDRALDAWRRRCAEAAAPVTETESEIM